jgi:hypothetical protein
MTSRTNLVAVAMLFTAGLTAPLPAQELKLRETLQGSEDNYFSLAYSADGKILASGTVRGDIYLWDTRTNRELAVLKGHTNVVLGVQFSPDGKLLASAGGLDGTARVWEVATGKLLHKFNLPDKDTVNGVAFSPDGKMVAACGFKGKLPVWDVVTGKQVDVFAGVEARCLEYSPDGKTLAWGSSPQSVRLRDLATGKEQFLAGVNMTIVKTIAFSPDSKIIAMAGSHRGDQGKVDNVIRVWDIAQRQEVRQLRGHGQNVYHVVFRSDGKLLASTGQDGTVRLWDVATGKQLFVHSGKEAALSVTFSRDGNTLAMTAGKTVTLWTVPNALRAGHHPAGLAEGGDDALPLGVGQGAPRGRRSEGRRRRRALPVEPRRGEDRFAREPPLGRVGDRQGNAEGAGQFQEATLEPGLRQPGPHPVEHEGHQPELRDVVGHAHPPWRVQEQLTLVRVAGVEPPARQRPHRIRQAAVIDEQAAGQPGAGALVGGQPAPRVVQPREAFACGVQVLR